MPGTLDLVLAILLAAGYPFLDYYVIWPRMRRTILAGGVHPRVPAYAELIATLWGMSLLVAATRVARALPWPDIGIAVPGGWRLGVSIGLVAALALLMGAQAAAVARLTPEARGRVRNRLGDLDLIVPHSPLERAWFVAVSITAGICEEFLYRGFLVWALTPWLGLWGAAAASLASFVSAHAYQGRAKLPNVAFAGALMAIVALLTHSVLPGMLLHTMIDVMGGETAYALTREAPTPSAA